MIYLDYQATTPVAPDVAQAMRPWAEEHFANPHSPSRGGREAAAAIEVARDQVEAAIGLGGGTVAFTGSATDPSAADTTAGITLAWTAKRDGTSVASGMPKSVA